MSERKGSNRREFLKTSSTLATAAALAGGLSVARGAHAAGSDAIKAVVIGCGGRGTGAGADCLNADPGVRIIALADAFENRAKGAADYYRREFKDRADVPQDRVFVGLDAFQKAIACNPDLVIIAGPPGFRPQQYSAAIAAGKHVFMEKPCCVDAPGYRTLVAANKMADEKGLRVGVGLQRHHDAGYQKGIEEIQAGKYGDILFMRAYWNGSDIWYRGREKGMNELQFQVHNWYHFAWLSGDNIGEQHIHNLDVCNWVKNDHPIEANGMGGCSIRYAGDRKGMGQIFDHHFVEFTYKDGSKMFSQCRHMPNTWNNVSEAVHGTKGAGGPTASGGKKLQFQNPYVQEHYDLIQAIRNGTKHNEGHYGATSSMTAVLGRMATYSGQVIKWDEAVAKGPDEAPDYLTWNDKPPVVPNSDGNYPIPVPGVFKPY